MILLQRTYGMVSPPHTKALPFIPHLGPVLAVTAPHCFTILLQCLHAISRSRLTEERKTQ